MASLVTFSRIPLRRFSSITIRRLVSTSSKKNDTAVVADACSTEAKTIVNKNWVSYGFNKEDIAEDRFWAHATAFATITLCITLGGVFYAYMPSMNYRDWAQREAFLELRRREKNGLPLVDPNLINIDKVQLPTDEELGDTDIII
ncbi:hypothetical protein HHI36_008997 [Cryptolaemus montrouzieri]|uniref:NADH dehydrogenase [ubiquinone] 1 beta subcomplex subunit 11, mitochondrial n=1 Tax=Cryptolaemus montrouzieri TaxID=559131 RepID=A0ABD2MU11_9CUCU